MDILIPLLIGLPVIIGLAAISFYRNRLKESSRIIESTKARIQQRNAEKAFADTTPNDTAGVTVTEMTDVEQQAIFELIDMGFRPTAQKSPRVVRGPTANAVAGVPIANSVFDDRNRVPSIDDAWRNAR
jgi:hypothetical protein